MAGEMREAGDNEREEKREEKHDTDNTNESSKKNDIQAADSGMDSAPRKDLEELLKEQGRTERDMMKKLINENVNLQRQNRQVSEKIKELQAKKEVMAIDLDCEKQNRLEIEEQVKDMQNEMKVLLIDAKRAQVKRTQKDGSTNDADTLDSLQTREQFRQCILHLQFRLKRLTEQQEAKDKILAELQKRLSEKEKLTEELEKNIPDECILEDIRRRAELEAEKDKTETVKRTRQTNMMRSSTHVSPNTSATSAHKAIDQPQQSRVCAIL